MSRPAAYLVDAATYFVGYALVSHYVTGGGIVDVRLITEGQEPTYTVLASVVAGLIAVLIWRTALWAGRHLRGPG